MRITKKKGTDLTENRPLREHKFNFHCTSKVLSWLVNRLCNHTHTHTHTKPSKPAFFLAIFCLGTALIPWIIDVLSFRKMGQLYQWQHQLVRENVMYLWCWVRKHLPFQEKWQENIRHCLNETCQTLLGQIAQPPRVSQSFLFKDLNFRQRFSMGLLWINEK